MIPPERLIRSVSEEHAERLREIAEAYRSEPNRDSDDDIANAEACLAGAAALGAAREQKVEAVSADAVKLAGHGPECRLQVATGIVQCGCDLRYREDESESASSSPPPSLSPGLAPEIEHGDYVRRAQAMLDAYPLFDVPRPEWVEVCRGLLELAVRHAPLAPPGKLRSLCGAVYQMAGVAGAPVRFLDALSKAANGDDFDADGLLPVLESEFAPLAPLQQQDARYFADAFLRLWREVGIQDADDWLIELCDQARAAVSPLPLAPHEEK